MNTYGMKNITIEEKKVDQFTYTYLVYADTERFGEHEIMAQFPTREAACKWLYENTGDEEVKEALENELSKKNGKIQIGNTMYRNIKRKNGIIYGYSHTDGTTELNGAFFEAKTIKGKFVTSSWAYSYQRTKTIKFGSNCTW